MPFTNQPSENDGKSSPVSYPVTVRNIDSSQLPTLNQQKHDELELVLVVRGCLQLFCEDDMYLVKKGRVIFINQQISHSPQFCTKEDCHMISVLFHPSFLFGLGETIFSSKYLLPVLTAPSLKHIVLSNSVPREKEIIDYTKEIITLNLEAKYGFELTTKEYLCHIWNLFLEMVTPFDLPGKIMNNINEDESRVNRAIQYIETHYAEPITLEDIAASIPLSKSECCRSFKRTMKLTPFQYLMKYRIFESARKMHRADWDSEFISDLAISVGFNSISYFNKLFKEYLNYTPKQYKQLIERGKN